jgi:muramidase (phage lysozyme)
MARLDAEAAGGQNVLAFLDMLAVSEGTAGRGDDGYNILVGGTTFAGYSAHPRKRVWLSRYHLFSTAAGRYQFLWRTWRALAKNLGLPDFSPESQDRGAIELIRERGALADVVAGRLDDALAKCAPVWASLPGAGYGQREQTVARLTQAFVDAGGQPADVPE